MMWAVNPEDRAGWVVSWNLWRALPKQSSCEHEAQRQLHSGLLLVRASLVFASRLTDHCIESMVGIVLTSWMYAAGEC
jgi:hypothetical protein